MENQPDQEVREDPENVHGDHEKEKVCAISRRRKLQKIEIEKRSIQKHLSSKILKRG